MQSPLEGPCGLHWGTCSSVCPCPGAYSSEFILGSSTKCPKGHQSKSPSRIHLQLITLDPSPPPSLPNLSVAVSHQCSIPNSLSQCACVTPIAKQTPVLLPHCLSSLPSLLECSHRAEHTGLMIPWHAAEWHFGSFLFNG